jgi:hypothetical protein
MATKGIVRQSRNQTQTTVGCREKAQKAQKMKRNLFSETLAPTAE